MTQAGQTSGIVELDTSSSTIVRSQLGMSRFFLRVLCGKESQRLTLEWNGSVFAPAVLRLLPNDLHSATNGLLRARWNLRNAVISLSCCVGCGDMHAFQSD